MDSTTHGLLAFLFTGEAPPQPTCRCGSGWCPTHGSDHYPDATELLEVERRQATLEMRGTHGGRRVIRRRKPVE